MKKTVFALTLVLMLAATGASANLIGLFADLDATQCAADFPVYAYTNVYVTAVLTDITSITAAEFRIDGVMLSPLVIISPIWNSPLTIGDALGDGDFVTIPCAGWCFVADCMVGGPHGECLCDNTIATEETSWGAVKSLF